MNATHCQPNPYEFAILGYILSNPHTSAGEIIDAMGITPDAVFKTINGLKTEGMIVSDKEMRVEASVDGLGVTKKRTYTANETIQTLFM